MVTENIRDMNNWVYLLDKSQRKINEEWTGNVCPHCIYNEHCDGSINGCKERGGFMYNTGASDEENGEYIEKNFPNIKFKKGSKD